MKTTIFALLLCLLFSTSSFAEKISQAKVMNLRVLTYNVQGLPWPIKKDRGDLEMIGKILGERRKNGTLPHITVLQEAFKTSKIKKLIQLSGYKYVIKGPAAAEQSPFDPKPKHCAPKDQFCRSREFASITNSGIYILSDFPILKNDKVAFGYRACAGFDCFSNKGILYAKVQIPGFSQPLHVFNTHMNCSGSSGVALELTDVARIKQTDILNWFIEKNIGDKKGQAVIALGDYNQGPKKRQYIIEDKLGMPNAQAYCLNNRSSCDILSKEPEEKLYEKTPDHQLYQSGSLLNLTPVELNKTFYDKVNDRQVSDHLGLEVVYKLEE